MKFIGSNDYVVQQFLPTLKRDGRSVTSARAVLLYHSIYGRNAWHSTWVRKYSEGSITTTLKDAKNYAERGRKPGSQFSIIELPAVEILSNEDTFFIVHINTQSPFKGCMTKKALDGLKNKTGATKPGFLRSGSCLAQALYTLTPLSPYWTENPGPKNSIIILNGSEDEKPSSLPSRKLIEWQSKTFGKKFYLGWTPLTNSRGSSAVKRVVKLGLFVKDSI